MSNPQYFTAQEAAELLGIKYPTLLARLRRGSVNAEKFGQWVWRISADEVERLREQKG